MWRIWRISPGFDGSVSGWWSFNHTCQPWRKETIPPCTPPCCKLGDCRYGNEEDAMLDAEVYGDADGLYQIRWVEL